MKIVLLEAFYGGSHKQWADGLKAHSQHDILILSLPDSHWKWRMHGAAITLAEKYNQLDFVPDLILATDMLDFNLFLSLTREKTAQVKTAIYFHENQLTYPWSPTDEDTKINRNFHYSFINYTSALAADKVFFNSDYHKSSFLNTLPSFLNMYPDFQNEKTIKTITSKSETLHLGMDLSYFEAKKPTEKTFYNRAVILWNHRWEYDKNPELFFESLMTLHHHGIDFKLIVLGDKTKQYPAIFDEAKEVLKEKIIHWGYCDSKDEYTHWLWHADILPVTAIQDFFGGSVVEAIACNTFPLLPDRLAYPEHLPQEYKNTFLYKDKHDFIRRLQRLIMDVRIIRKQNKKQWVQQYDWKNCIEKYDERLLF
ncbi:MAG: tRNA-queuosine alpha-mannosyltransferase domain-containing protein [Chitinophagales bacterium]